MPDITISPAQAAALARGENITIEAPKPDPVVKHFIAVAKRDGGVYEYETHDGDPQPWTVVRSTRDTFVVGYTYSKGFNFKNDSAYVVVEVKS